MDKYNGIEKTIKINGEKVTLLANTQNAVIFRANFGKDFLRAFYDVSVKAQEGGFPMSDEELFQFTWTLAKTYNRDFAPYEEWLNSLKDFPFFEVAGVVIELLKSNFVSTTDIEEGKKDGRVEK